MAHTYTLSPDATLFHADCREAMRALPDNCIDAVVTDPPYGLQFMNATWDRLWRDRSDVDKAWRDAHEGTLAARARKLPDYSDMGRGEQIQASHLEWAREAFRVLKPGGHIAAFSASRTYHRMACAIEDAGFEIRDSLMWLFGCGFPKGRQIALEYEQTLCYSKKIAGGGTEWRYKSDNTLLDRNNYRHPAAQEWDGYGTHMKPAFEPIVFARKPLSEGTVAANVLRWRTGALNIDGCRVPSESPILSHGGVSINRDVYRSGEFGKIYEGGGREYQTHGRWPANVLHDGSDEVVGMFPSSAGQLARARTDGALQNNVIYGALRHGTRAPEPRGDSGSAARFFYSAKASKADRAGSKHPTVKPISLMSWLARFITPPGGVILDPFAGSGTTGAAAMREGFKCILAEREAEYVRDILTRFGVAAASESVDNQQAA